MSRRYPRFHIVPGALIFAGAACLLFFLFLPRPDFNAFTMKLFQSELSKNTLTLHYTLAKPDAFGIKDPPVTLGTPFLSDSDTDLKETIAKYSSLGLSEEDQRTADLLSWWLDGQTALADLSFYQEPLGPTLGVQAQLPILLAEYAFRTEQDIQDYLTLLAQLPDYFSRIAEFEQEKAEAGLLMNQESLSKVIEQCESFPSNPATHFLTESFQKRLSDCTFLSVNEQIDYELQNQHQLRSSVFPAYEQLATGLEELLVKAPSEELGLSYFPNGASYFQWLLTYETGTDRTISEIRDLLEEQIASDYETILEAVQNDVNLLHPVSETPLKNTEPGQLLLYLSQKITDDFPAIPDTDWQIKNVPDALSKYLSPAFFLTPPLDTQNETTIYINPSYEPDEKELLTTLAHEGYPGHLYQNTFETSLPPVRSLIYVGGYTEGWGLYSELFAYDFLGYSEETASALRALTSLNYAICSVLDLEIHTSGWNESACTEYLHSYGITDSSQIHHLYLSILEEPANYLKYYLGYLEICKLKESAFTHSPDLSLTKFHQWFLENGPAPFFLLEADLHQNFLK